MGYLFADQKTHIMHETHPTGQVTATHVRPDVHLVGEGKQTPKSEHKPSQHDGIVVPRGGEITEENKQSYSTYSESVYGVNTFGQQDIARNSRVCLEFQPNMCSHWPPRIHAL